MNKSLLIILCVILIQSTQSIIFAPLHAANKLKVILKLDDLAVKNNVFAAAPAFDFMKSKHVKWAAGAIASRFDATARAVLTPYINAVNEKGDTLMEVWHHGYDHSNNKTEGTTEFSNRSYEDQKQNFEQANQRIKTLLGIQMHSFGTPYNRSDSVTNRVVAENANYKVFMFSSVKSSTNGLLYLDNRVNMENGTGSPDYEYFVKNYLAKKGIHKDYIVVQGHPNSYTVGSSNLEQFKLIIEFLISEDVEFVRPYDFFKSKLETVSASVTR